jgi:hypothetical protein
MLIARRHPVIRLVAALAFIATAAPALQALHAQGVRARLGAWIEPVLLDTLRQDFQVAAPPAKVYDAALRAFAALDIPTGTTDGKAGIIGSDRFERSHVLVGSPMSRSFSCGEGATGEYANSFRVDIVVVVWVAPQGDGTKLGVATAASARDMSGEARSSKRCASTGTLEQKLFERITKLATP